MSRLDTKPDTTEKTTKPGPAPAHGVEAPSDTAAVITEQQVLFASAAALAPAPAARPGVTHRFALSVRAIFVRPERARAPKHYPQRFVYLENSVMSREMGRL